MTNAYSYRLEKFFELYKTDSEIAPIYADIEKAKKGVMSFSAEVKKFMLKAITPNYPEVGEVGTLIRILKSSSKYESYNTLDIFRLGDECYFWFDFLNIFAVYKIIMRKHKLSTEAGLKVLVKLLRFENEEFDKYFSFK